MALRECRECKKEISNEANKCPHCGASSKRKTGFLLIIGIFFLPMVFSWLLLRKGHSNFSRIVGFSWLAIAIIIITTSPEVKEGQNINERISEQSQKKERPISNLQFKTIRKQMETMTEAQFDAYKKTIQGERIKWTGWVEEVNSKMLGGYELLVDMDNPNSDFSVQDISFEIPDNLALSLSKDKRVTFEGEIEQVLNILTSCQVKLKKATVIEYQK